MKTSSFTKMLSPMFLTLVLLMSGLLWAGNAEAACKAAFKDSVSGKTVYFYSTSTAASSSFSLIWNFGDKTKGSGTNPTHTYSSYGASYTVCLVVFDSINKCFDTACATVTTAKSTCSASAHFTATGGGGGSVKFSNASKTSSGVYSSVWDFNDKTSSKDNSPGHTFKTNGVYQVCLMVTDSVDHSCTATYCMYDTIKTAGSCYANYKHSISGSTLYTSNGSSSKYGYTSSWNWGDGSASTSTNPVHTYAKNGYYHACLTITDTIAKCNAAYCDSITINIPCAASFVYATSKLTAGFSDSGSSALANKHSASWDFGDATKGTGDYPTHTYGKNGTYTACVTVYDSSTGCSAKECKNITVGNCSLTVSYTTSISGSTVVFSGTTNASSHSKIKWIFGDGTGDSSSGLKVTHIYSSTKGATAYLIVYDSATGCTQYYSKTFVLGCSADASFTHSYVNVSTPGLSLNYFSNKSNASSVKYSWNFGDKSALSDSKNPSHTFPANGTYHVCLTATDSTSGCSSTNCEDITVSTCNLKVSFSDSASGHTVKFFGYSSATSHISIIWIFGDGKYDSTSNLNVTHVYSSTATFENVYMRVYDSTTKCTSYANVPVYFCSALSDYTYAIKGLAVSFKGDAANKSTSKYSWSFGDKSSPGTTFDPTHTYSSAGTYTACLTVTDSSGCNTQTCHSFTISNCSLTASFKDSVAGHKVYFYGNTNASAHYSFKWYFGDGATDSTSGLSPTHTYSNTYNRVNAYLRIYDSTTKCTQYATGYVNICTALSDYTYKVNGLSVSFKADPDNRSSAKYQWDFSDKSSGATTGDPTHTYSKGGTYNVCLTVTDSGCSTTSCHSITLTYCITGTVTTGKTAGYPATVYLITYNSSDTSLKAVDSTKTDSIGDYEFCGLSNGTYYTKAALDAGNADYKHYIPTYHNDATQWAKATKITVSNANVSGANIDMKKGSNKGGAGFIGGKIKAGANKTGDPEIGILVVLYDSANSPVAYTYSNSTGDFSFSGIAYGTYYVYGEIPGYVCTPSIVTINDTYATNDNTILLVNMLSNTIVAAIKPIGNWNVEKANVYPNPVTDKLTLSLSLHNANQVNLKIYDITGKVVSELNTTLGGGAQKMEVDASSLPAGLYFLRMEMLKDNTIMEAQFVRAR